MTVALPKPLAALFVAVGLATVGASATALALATERTARKPELRQCLGVTVKSRRCRNMTRSADGYCYLHHWQAERSELPR